MEDKHFQSCGAPICAVYGGNVWYPGEEVCQARPKSDVQKVQNKIQKLFEKGKIDDDKYFTVSMLSSIERVRAGMQGANPSNGSLSVQNSALSAVTKESN